MNKEMVNTTKKILINSDLDVILARSCVREVARDLGFGSIDQARISLAAGELARILAKSWNQNNEIVVSGVSNGNFMGIQVIGIYTNRPVNGSAQQVDDSEMKDIRKLTSLVDEHQIENQGTRVTLMKWLP